MARLLLGPHIPMQNPGGPITFLVFLAAIASVFSAVIFMCGSHGGGAVKSPRRSKDAAVRLGGERKTVIQKMKSGLSSNAWRKVQAAEEEEEEEEDRNDVVWKKAIMKGEKCKPIDFSGKILYDTDGNLLTD